MRHRIFHNITKIALRRRQYIRSEEDASRLGAMAIVARRINICNTSLDRLKAPAFLMYLPVVQHKNNQIKLIKHRSTKKEISCI
jgi:hypothetical protein